MTPFPGGFFLDSRLSALDKMAWVMIRLYAQSNEGAVFPTYDELQLQLASPHAGEGVAGNGKPRVINAEAYWLAKPV